MLRVLAREPRVRRRLLARSLKERVTGCPPAGESSFRSMLPSFPGDPHYVFVIATPDASPHDLAGWDKYRDIRRAVLTAYAQVAMEYFKDANTVVGIATEGGLKHGRSHDLVMIERENWSEELAEEARKVRESTGWFRKLALSQGTEDEYPTGPPALGRHFIHRTHKVGRNEPCPCGSGKKYKKCHG
jgi:hypothetical protein